MSECCSPFTRLCDLKVHFKYGRLCSKISKYRIRPLLETKVYYDDRLFYVWYNTGISAVLIFQPGYAVTGISSAKPAKRSIFQQFLSLSICGFTSHLWNFRLENYPWLGTPDLCWSGGNCLHVRELCYFKSRSFAVQTCTQTIARLSAGAYRRCYLSLCVIYIGWQWHNFFITNLCQLFFCHDIGKLWETFVIVASLSLVRQW